MLTADNRQLSDFLAQQANHIYICHIYANRLHGGDLMMSDDGANNCELPLNPRTFMILLAFAEGPAHGYEVRRRAEQRSRGAVQLDAGSLYRSIAQLVDQGLIDEVEVPGSSEARDARRRYYGLTSGGRRLLSAEAERLAGLVDYAREHHLVERPEVAG